MYLLFGATVASRRREREREREREGGGGEGGREIERGGREGEGLREDLAGQSAKEMKQPKERVNVHYSIFQKHEI